MFLKVNAYALNEHTGMSTVASDVNHRWFKHIVLPSVLGGVGRSEVFTKTPTHRSFRETTAALPGTGVGMPTDGEALAGVIAGGMAEQGSQLLTRRGERTFTGRVTVSRGGCLHSVC